MRRYLLSVVLALAASCPGTVLAQDGKAMTGTPSAPSTSNADETVGILAKTLTNEFVFPELGAQYAAMLTANVDRGAYANLTGEALAKRLTSDLQAVHPDGHLHLRAMTQEELEKQKLFAIRPPNGAKMPDIEQARWLAPGIAFVRFNLFPPDDANIEAVAKFMADHATAKTIIFDIRTHRGGIVDQIDEVAAWLYVKPTRLLTMAMRRSVEDAMILSAGGEGPPPNPPTFKSLPGTPQESMREHWAIPNGDSRLHNARVYVLTSPRTGSAAEHFALALKVTGRATLVGTATGGANHFGGEQILPGGLAVFVPFGRTFNPATGADWEGVGVAPDIKTSPENALVTVLLREGLTKAKAKQLSDSVRPTGSMVRVP